MGLRRGWGGVDGALEIALGVFEQPLPKQMSAETNERDWVAGVSSQGILALGGRASQRVATRLDQLKRLDRLSAVVAGGNVQRGGSPAMATSKRRRFERHQCAGGVSQNRSAAGLSRAGGRRSG